MNRDDYRKIKSFSKTEMERWLQLEQNITYNKLRKIFEQEYHDELDSSIQNFITSIAYTLHFNEDVHLNPDELSSFMDDLFVSVEMFRKGEYKPEEYEEQLKEDGIIIAKYDYDRLYRECRDKTKKEVEQQYLPYKNRVDEALEFLKHFQNGNLDKITEDDISKMETILKGEYE